MATQRSKKGSEKVLGRVLGRALRRGPAMGFTVKKGSEKAVSRRCLERPLGDYDPLGVHPVWAIPTKTRMLDHERFRDAVFRILPCSSSLEFSVFMMENLHNSNEFFPC